MISSDLPPPAEAPIHTTGIVPGLRAGGKPVSTFRDHALQHRVAIGAASPAFCAIARASASVRVVRRACAGSASGSRGGTGRRGFHAAHTRQRQSGAQRSRDCAAPAKALRPPSARSRSSARASPCASRCTPTSRAIRLRSARSRAGRAGGDATASNDGALTCPVREAGDVLRGACREHHRLEQRVRSQPVGAVHAGCRAFADRPEACERRPSAFVDRNSTHVVVLGRCNRNEIVRRIDAGRSAARVNRRKPFARKPPQWRRAHRGTRRVRRRSRRTPRVPRRRAVQARHRSECAP